MTTAARHAEIEAGLTSVRDRVAAACAAAGRSPDDVTLVVVTKTRPTSDIRILFDLGVRDVGENRDQEAAPKATELADLDLCWHFVGQLQRNKAASVARYAQVVHSVDRVRLVTALDHGAERAGRVIRAFVQVDLESGEHAGRGGCPPADVPDVCAAVAAAPHLDLAGLMAVAPLGEPPAPAFAGLAEMHRRIVDTFPTATGLSAGMSGDLEEAIAAGATHVRVGSAVLGERDDVR